MLLQTPNFRLSNALSAVPIIRIVALEKVAGSSPVGHPPTGRINETAVEKVSRHAPALDFSSCPLTLTVVAQPTLAFSHNAVVAVAGGVAVDVRQQLKAPGGDSHVPDVG